MSKHDDESLGDVTQDATHEDFIDDEPGTLPAPEDYDFGAMVAGVKPNRARARVRPRSDLYATLEALAEQINDYPADEDVPDDLIVEWEQAKAAYDQTFVVVVEGRSSDWVKQFTRDMKKRGVNPQRKGLTEEQVAEQTRTFWHAQIAAQIVHPTKGVSAESVAALFAASETEGDKLWRAVRRVNTQPSGVAPDFSRKPSVRSPGGSA